MFSKTTVKYIQSLHHKKFRDELNAFIAEGPKVVSEFLDTAIFTCLNIYALPTWANDLNASLKQSLADKLVIVQDFELQKISALSKANAVVGVFEKKSAPVPDIKNKITLVLDDIQDPGNLGTIIRIADWFGVNNIFCSLSTADMYNTKVVQSTMASLGRVNVFYTDLNIFLSETSVTKYAAVMHGKPLAAVGKLKEGIIIIGNESKGISDSILKLADESITIPGIGDAESLNAGVAAGIILYSITNSDQ